ncbi:uncharacterized protein LOC106024910 isoform X2 [Esox lucius]|uniref:uncharacterized protein LOC106024910 isoform X2 n=1 Tax=Esox lucius TaxID=8010 RepID=UPI00147738F2|nr:uncharacterized protein LOC106024910 isoform X2 [Esox lucius]
MGAVKAVWVVVVVLIVGNVKVSCFPFVNLDNGGSKGSSATATSVVTSASPAPTHHGEPVITSASPAPTHHGLSEVPKGLSTELGATTVSPTTHMITGSETGMYDDRGHGHDRGHHRGGHGHDRGHHRGGHGYHGYRYDYYCQNCYGYGCSWGLCRGCDWSRCSWQFQ